jgi:hypothetical protein
MTREIETKKIEAPLQRVLLVFNKETNELAADLSLVNFDLAKFKSRFHRDADDEDELMIYCYQVSPEDVEFISNFLAEKHEFDFSRYLYSVEAYVLNKDWVKHYST